MKSISEKLETITPGKAREYLRLNTYDGQRPVEMARVRCYSEKMKMGLFHIAHVVFVNYKQNKWLGDAQHSLMACVKSGVPFRAVVEHYDCITKKDVAEVFGQFNMEKPRSRGDVAWVYAVQRGWGHWPKGLVRLLAAALVAVEGGGYRRCPTMPKDQQGALLFDNTGVCKWLCNLKITKVKHLKRGPVVSAMIQTWRSNAADAVEFWRGVSDGEMMEIGRASCRERV